MVGEEMNQFPDFKNRQSPNHPMNRWPPPSLGKENSGWHEFTIDASPLLQYRPVALVIPCTTHLDATGRENSWLVFAACSFSYCSWLRLWAISAEMPEGRLMRFADIYKDKIVFSYAGDLWLVSSSGGVARRITTDPGLELFPQIFARRQVDRLHGAIRRQLQCLRDARGRRRAQATDLRT